MGGIWESSVKPIKYNVCQIMATQFLIFKEVSKLLTQIEGYLNSRPITQISNDPNDLMNYLLRWIQAQAILMSFF